MLNRDQILAADDRRVVPVDVPEWGGEVGIRVMALSERIETSRAWQESSADDDRAMMPYRFLASVLCDDKGEVMFGNGQLEDLATRSSGVLDRLVARALKINGLGDDDDEEEEKKDERMPTGGLPTG